ncbi:MAG: protocatechuate 3,4-dioxygenase [Kiloniellaceae bacterium]
MDRQELDRERNIRRRSLLTAGLGAAAGALLFVPRSPLAAALPLTPRQTAGPFYPVEIPADSDRNLVQVAGRPAAAAGQVIEVHGQVRDDRGRPLAGGRVEIWQCDAFGRYHHPGDRGGGADPNFQGFGQSGLDSEGRYAFRTIKPVPYPGRAPHIHFAVAGPGVERLTTQMYLAGHPGNAGDFLYNAIRDRAARDSVTVAFEAAPQIAPGVEAGRFDLVLGRSL